MAIPKLISISGSVHSGKTTISRMIASQMPNAFYIDGDLISALIGEKYPKGSTIDDMLPEVHQFIIQLIVAGFKNGLDIIVDYPFSDKTRIQIVQGLEGIKFDPKWFLFKPDIHKVLKGSKHRPRLNHWEIERIKYHYAGDMMDTKLAEIIDSTDDTPEETVNKIMEGL